MGGDLHRHHAHALGDHAAHQATQGQGVWGGVRGGDVGALPDGAERADKARGDAAGLQDLADHPGGCALAVCAGHTDKVHLGERVVKERVAQRSQRGAGVRGDPDGAGVGVGEREGGDVGADFRGLNEQDGGALCKRNLQEVVTIGFGAAQGDKEAAPVYLSAVNFNRRKRLLLPLWVA